MQADRRVSLVTGLGIRIPWSSTGEKTNSAPAAMNAQRAPV